MISYCLCLTRESSFEIELEELCRNIPKSRVASRYGRKWEVVSPDFEKRGVKSTFQAIHTFNKNLISSIELKSSLKIRFFRVKGFLFSYLHFGEVFFFLSFFFLIFFVIFIFENVDSEAVTPRGGALPYIWDIGVIAHSGWVETL